MRSRRLLLFGVSLLVGLMAATALLSPVPSMRDGVPSSPAGARPGERDPAEVPRLQDRHPESDQPRALSAQERDQRVEAPAGRQVLLEIRTDVPVSVQVGEDGPIELAEPEAPAEFAVFVEEGLSEPIRLVETGREIGRLVAEGAASRD